MIDQVINEAAQSSSALHTWLEPVGGGVGALGVVAFFANKFVTGMLAKVDSFMNKHLEAETITAENTTEMKNAIGRIDASVAVAVKELTGNQTAASGTNGGT